MPMPDLPTLADTAPRHLRRATAPWSARLAVGLGAAALTGLALLAGCGGGGSSGAATGATTTSGTTAGSTAGTNTAGSTTTTTTTTTPTVTTAATAAYTEGTITGFGSVIVNGVRFDDSSCTVTDDSGATSSTTALKLGMRVEITSSSVDGSTSTAKATKLSHGSRLVGPVSAVGAGTLTVLGQVVDLVDATVFDSSSLPNGAADITTGKVVEVHGLPDTATGHLLATRVEAPSSVSAYKLRGAITALDTTAKTLNIGSTSVSYGSATLSPSTLALATGLVVRLTFATTLDTSAQPYAALTLSAPGRATTTGQAAHVRGTVAAWDATAKSFTLDGLKVDASAVTTLPATLANGVEVDVVGTVSNSVLVATAVTLKAETRGRNSENKSRFELHGAITSVDTTAQTFLLRGITVGYASASFSPSTKTVADLVAGAKVEVKGTLGSTRTQLTATTVRFED